MIIWVEENLQVRYYDSPYWPARAAGISIPNMGYDRKIFIACFRCLNKYSFGAYEYNNITFIIAAELIKAYRQAGEDNVRERIFQPLE